MLKKIMMVAMLSACAPVNTFAMEGQVLLEPMSFDSIEKTVKIEAKKYDKARGDGTLSPILDTLTDHESVLWPAEAQAFMSATSPVDALKYALEVQQSAIYPVRLMIDIDEVLLTKLEPFSERQWKLNEGVTLTADEATHFTALEGGWYYPKVNEQGKITAPKELQDKFTNKRGNFNPTFPRNLVPSLANAEALAEFEARLEEFKAAGGEAYGYTTGLRSEHVSKALATYGITFTQEFGGKTQLNLHDFPFHEHDTVGTRKSPDELSFIEKKSLDPLYGGPTRQFTNGIFFLEALSSSGCFLKGPAFPAIINHFNLPVSGGTNILVDNKILNGLSTYKEWTAAGFKTRVVYIPA